MARGIVLENQSAFVSGRLIADNALIALEIFLSMKHNFRGRRGLIPVKFDMSKAYNKVKWEFLKCLLLKLGFPERCLKLIIDCVSSIRYLFVVNGSLCSSIVPSMGLR